MIPTLLRRDRLRGFVFPSGLVVAVSFVLLAVVSLLSAQNPTPPKPGEAVSSSSESGVVKDQATLNTPVQKGEAKKSSIEMTKSDVAELSALADQLRDEVRKMNPNVLSLDVIRKAEKVEKLARKIKGEANGN
jgi:hypothetical protein